MITFGSLFAGIGGFDLGFERAGMHCRWQVEIDLYCQRVLAKHWPDAGRWDDIRTFPPAPAEDWSVAVICGGFPCQPVSNAGLRRGDADDRWLWPEFVRIIRTLRPSIVVLENTPGLFTCGFGAVLGDLASLGYDAEWSLLSACRMDAPHTRERVFVMAYAAGCLGEKGIRIRQSEASCEISTGDTIAAQVLRMESSHRNCGVPDGFSIRMDGRLRSLGNAVVPQCAEWIGRRIVAALSH